MTQEDVKKEIAEIEAQITPLTAYEMLCHGAKTERGAKATALYQKLIDLEMENGLR